MEGASCLGLEPMKLPESHDVNGIRCGARLTGKGLYPARMALFTPNYRPMSASEPAISVGGSGGYPHTFVCGSGGFRGSGATNDANAMPPLRDRVELHR